MFKVNNKNTKTTPGVFTVNFEHISNLFLLFLSAGVAQSGIARVIYA